MGRLLRCVALCAVVACGHDRRPSAQIDTSTPRRAVEVHTPPPDSALRAATAAVDSLDARFGRARAALDSDAATLRDANRLDSAYAGRYEAFETKRKSALALRDARDRARRTRDAIAARERATTG
jgi:hypothetical protein